MSDLGQYLFARLSEPNELVDGYDPADPPQEGCWCAACEHWEDDCRCPAPEGE